MNQISEQNNDTIFSFYNKPSFLVIEYLLKRERYNIYLNKINESLYEFKLVFSPSYFLSLIYNDSLKTLEVNISMSNLPIIDSDFLYFQMFKTEIINCLKNSLTTKLNKLINNLPKNDEQQKNHFNLNDFYKKKLQT